MRQTKTACIFWVIQAVCFMFVILLGFRFLQSDFVFDIRNKVANGLDFLKSLVGKLDVKFVLD